jgi:dihydroorotase
VLIADGMIRDARRGIGAAGVPEGTDIINCAGKVVAPGLVDMRAFVGEPGAGHRETFASASSPQLPAASPPSSASPIPNPSSTIPRPWTFVLRRARDTAIVNIHPMAALTKGMKGDEMTEIGLLKAAGAVAFTDGDKSVMNALVMRRALTYARDFDALIVHHTEDPHLVGEGVMNEGEFASRHRPDGNSQCVRSRGAGARHAPRGAHRRPLSRGVPHLHRLARYSQTRARTRAECQRLGLDQPHHAERKRHRSLPHLPQGLAAACAPRTIALALVAGLETGLIDVIMSDHNPQDVEVKRLPFAEAAPGAIGLETMLSAGLRLVHSGEVDLKTLIRAMSTRPAELLGLPGGSLRPGSPADVIVIDLDTPWILDPADLKSQCKNTPFDEARFSGACRAPSSTGAPCMSMCDRVLKTRHSNIGRHHERFSDGLRAESRAGLPVRLSVRLDSVRTDPDQARGHARSALHRLGQYRRDQCAAHRQQGPRRGDAARRYAEGHHRRDRRRLFRRTERRDRRWCSARSSATSSRCG